MQGDISNHFVKYNIYIKSKICQINKYKKSSLSLSLSKILFMS